MTITIVFATMAVGGQFPPPKPAIDDLSMHPFLANGRYADDNNQPTILQITKGVMMWVRSVGKEVKGRPQDFNDFTVVSNGDLVYATMAGAGLASTHGPGWFYEAPPNTEIDSIQKVAGDRMLVMQNGSPAKALFFDTKHNKIVKQVTIPTAVKDPHDMFRQVRMTLAGTLVVPHLAENKVCEYDLDGKQLWSVKTPSPWSAQRLWNGNTLIAGDWHHYAREVDKSGKTVWEFTQNDLPTVPLGNVHIATRLSNGNTLLAFWFPESPKSKEWPGNVEILEVTKDKKIVWAVSSWQSQGFGDFIGPINTMQLLDQAVTDENVYAGP